MRKYITATDVANEIRMLRQKHKKIMFVAEGKNDSFVLRALFETDPDCIVISYGKENVIELSKTLTDEGCIFLVDRDFDEEISTEPVVSTDLHSIESYIIKSESVVTALTIILTNTGSKAVADIREELCSTGIELTKWKYAFNQLNKSVVDEESVRKFLNIDTGEVTDVPVRARQLDHSLTAEDCDTAIETKRLLDWTASNFEKLCPKIWIAILSALSIRRYARRTGNLNSYQSIEEIVLSSATNECFENTLWLENLAKQYNLLLKLGFEPSSQQVAA